MKRMTLLLVFVFIIITPLKGMAYKTYTVKKGDNLYRISKRFNIRIDKIREANNLNSDKLPVGLKLMIPTKGPDRERHVKMDMSSKEDVSPIKKEEIRYTIKEGDTLWKIGRRFNVSVRELERVNHIKSGALKPGRTLIVGYKIIDDVREDEVADVVKDTEELPQSIDTPSMTKKEQLVMFAKKMLGVSYRVGSNTFNILDCSSFVQWVFSQIGISLPRTAREQFGIGIPVDKEDLSIGDLVFFKTYALFPSHVGIYLGDDLFIHTSTSTRRVTIDNINTPYYINRFIGAKRLLLDEPE